MKIDIVSMNIGIVLIVMVVLPIALILTNAKEKAKKLGTAAQQEKVKYHKRYIYYMNNLFFRRRFRRIVQSYSCMMCFDYDELKKISVKTFEKAVLMAGAMPVISMVIFRNIFLTALMFLVGYIFYDISVDRAIDKQEVIMREALSFALQSIRDTHSITDNIPKALSSCERQACLERPIMKIFEILTDENGYELLKEFKRTNPVRILGTLATACYVTNNDGDLKSNDGSSSFRDELTVIRQEADSGVRGLTKTSIAFKSLSKLSLVGLAIIPVADLYLLSNIPGMTVYLKGTYGSVVKAITIVLTLICYYVISVLSRPSVVNQVDKIEFIDNIARNPKYKKYIKRIQPKKYKLRKKLQNLVNGSLSSKDNDYIYACKAIMSAAMFVFSILMIISFIISARYALWHHYDSLAFTKIEIKHNTVEVQDKIKEIDEIYMTQEYKMADDDASRLVSSNIPSMTDLEVEQQVDRLNMKWDYYQKAKFKWWMIILAYGIGVAGWYMPEVSLLLRKMLVKFEASEDVMQLQTVMLTLSNTKMDVFKALKWLMIESTVHKAPLQMAWLSYPSDPEDALRKLKDSVSERDMKRMISKLEKAVYALSLKDAFSDIALDKNQSLVLNEMFQDAQIKSKSQTAKMFVAGTAGFSLIANFILPFLLLGITQITSAFALMQ